MADAKGAAEVDWSVNGVMVVETEDLIAQVHSKRCLWDNQHKNYVKRDHQRASWAEVAAAMKAPSVLELKKRWRGLRDTYSRELRRLEAPEGTLTDAQLGQLSNWRYFPLLSFLRHVVGHNRAKRKAEEVPDNDGSRSDRSSPDKEKISEGLGSVKVSIKQENESLPSPAQAPPASREEAPLPPETSTNDADEQFLKSLLPFLQDVPRHRKLLVRAQLLQVLMDDQHIDHLNNR